MRIETENNIVDLHPTHDEPYRTVEVMFGFRWPKFHQSIQDAVRSVDGARQAELTEVEEFVPGARVLVELATVLDGEWYFNDERRLNMATVKKAAARNVADDLIGGSTKKSDKAKGKPAPKGKPAAAKKSTESRSGYKDTQRIKILKASTEFKAGSRNAEVFEMLKKSATIGDYRKARKKKLGDDKVGSVLGTLVKKGVVKVL